MGRIVYNNSDLSKLLREARGQGQEVEKESPKKKSKRNAESSYTRFLRKYYDLENSIDSFGTKDLLFFFREKSRESGNHYVIANMQRDMGIFKRLQEDFSVEEILLMIEFIFSGDQTYLNVSHTQPTVLVSNWINSIYPDSILWSKDEYVDKKDFYKNKNRTTREWSSKENNTTKIGEWDL